MPTLTTALEGVQAILLAGGALLAGLTGWITLKVSLAELGKDLEAMDRNLKEHQRDATLHINREALDERLARLSDGLSALRDDAAEIRRDTRALRELLITKGDHHD